jgi:predicted GNAT family acetyltransferase
VERHEDVASFRDVAMPFLMADEVANCMLIGLVAELVAVRRTVWDGDRLCAVLLQTPGRPAMISTGPADAGDVLGTDAARHGDITGVYAPTDIARAFCEAYTRATGREAELHFRGAVHRLERVIPPTGVSGEFSVAAGEDRVVAVPWVDAFARSIGEPTRDAEAHFDLLVGQRRLHLWRDGGRPVSMAAWAGPTPNGVRINSVYTPPEFRNRGYASAVVAALSQRMLDSGKTVCFLNTDLANPTSNSIYRKIGYMPCGERESYRFQQAP